MNSINNNQPERNHKDLQGPDAIEKIQELAGKASTCFFCTSVVTGRSGATRPMSIQEVDDSGHLWFLSAADSHTNAEITADPKVDLYFQGSAHAGFIHLQGTAYISQDKARIKELWEPIMKVWFTEGEDDPRISVIKVVPDEGYYWDNKHGNFVAGIKIVIGAAIGHTLDDSIEGKVNV